MKVYINKPKNNWVSPYSIIEKLMFWREIEYKEPVVKYWSDKLFPLCLVLQKIMSILRPEISYVKVDRWDAWSFSHTLSPIILPMLKELKKQKHGAGFVDPEDSPIPLRLESDEFSNEHDANIFARYDWLLDELIWTFTQLQPDFDWESQYRTGESEIDFTEYPEDVGQNFTPLRWKKKAEVDWVGMEQHQKRIQNGLNLFGKYFLTFWD